MKKIYILKLLVVFILANGQAQGLLDGFMTGKGNVDVAVSYMHESFDRYFVKDIETINGNLGTITTQSLSLFTKVGITNFLDVIATVPYVHAAPNAGYWQTQQGLQDLSLYIKVRPYQVQLKDQSRFDVMLAAGIITPVSDYIPDAPVAIGHQSTQFDGRVIAQFYHHSGIFASGQAGYFRRNNVMIDRGYEVSVPDAWDYVARLGFNHSLFYTHLFFQSQRARSGTNIGPGVPFPSNAISFDRAGVTLAYKVPLVSRLTVFGGYTRTLSGRNIGDTTGWNGGIVYGFGQLF
ncbi:MAG: transporter [Saprospiraceae bacterium]